MIIKISELQPEGLAVRDVGQFSTSPFADPSWQLESLSLRVQPDGADVLVQGQLEATVPQTCGRCVEPLRTRVTVDVDACLAPRPAAGDNVELRADDLDTDFYANDELDLGALIETETTLALPMRPLCREDCRGLCPVCGVNRNFTSCECRERQPDPRLAVLRQLSVRPKD